MKGTKPIDHNRLPRNHSPGPNGRPVHAARPKAAAAIMGAGLPEITGEDPVPVADRGDIIKMTDAWLSWGKEHGYL